MDQQLIVNISGEQEKQRDKRPPVWLEIEQETRNFPRSTANLHDVLTMVNQIRGGGQAMTGGVAGCPVSINDEATATITLPFYVFPSSLGLPYSLSGGDISPAEYVEVERDFDLIARLTNTVDIGYLFDGTITPESPCINLDGHVVGCPPVEIVNGQLVLPEPLFCVYRMAGRAKGYRHDLKITIQATDEVRVTNIKPTVCATWQDADGKEQKTILEFEVPQCVEDMLKTCPTGAWQTVIYVKRPPQRQVYYNTCNGKTLAVRYRGREGYSDIIYV